MFSGKWFEMTKPVPASTLCAMARAAWAFQQGLEDDEFDLQEQIWWEVPWEHWLELPLAFKWSAVEDDPPVPEEVWKQLIGQKLGKGMHFTHEGKECYSIAFDAPRGAKLGYVLTEEDVRDLQFLHGVETKYIDMEA